MRTDGVLDVLETTLRSFYQDDGVGQRIIVMRVPEGIVILERGGEHVLVQAKIATLEVAS